MPLLTPGSTLRVCISVRCTLLTRPAARIRRFATHRDNYPTNTNPPPPHGHGQGQTPITQSLLSQMSNRTQTDNVGPFALQLDRSPGKAEDMKPWKELSAAGKVKRTTVRTTNFGIILLGAGLSVVIVYALATELFARNSPTVLYGEICDRLKASPELTKILQPPLIFHNTPPSTNLPRHRGRQVPAQLVVDQSGREHLVFRFWLEAKGSRAAQSSAPKPVEDPDEPLLDKLTRQGTVLADQAWTQTRRALAFLTGEPLPPLPTSPSPPRPPPPEEVREEKKRSGGMLGLFGGLRGSLGGKKKVEEKVELEEEGEVHVDMVKNEAGNFVYRHLFVDIPSTRSRRARRIYIEGSPTSDGQSIIWQ